MLAPLTKATERTRADRLLAIGARSIRSAFLTNIDAATAPALIAHVRELLSEGGLNQAVSLLVDRHATNYANSLAAVFVDTAAAEVAALSRRLVLHKATIGLTFNQSDPRAVALMQRNRLAQVQGITRAQTLAVRAALVRATQLELGTSETSRLVRQALGLSPAQQRSLETYAQGQRTLRTEALAEGEGGIVFSERQIAEAVERQAKRALAARAERIGRTESLKIVGQAREQGLLQSLEATGQRVELTGVEWNATHDGRTRSLHENRDGARRRLGEAFAPGIYKPGDGGPEESINCRCVPTYEFFDTEAELQAWLRGGS